MTNKLWEEHVTEVFHGWTPDGDFSIDVECHYKKENTRNGWRITDASYEMIFGDAWDPKATIWLDRNGRCEGDKCNGIDADELLASPTVVNVLNDSQDKVGIKELARLACDATSEFMATIGEDLCRVLVMWKSQGCTPQEIRLMWACEYSPTERDDDTEWDFHYYDSIDSVTEHMHEIIDRPVIGSNDMWDYKMAKMTIKALEAFDY